MPETNAVAFLPRLLLALGACCLSGACMTVATTSPGMPAPISFPSGSPGSGPPSSGIPSGSPGSGTPSAGSPSGSPSAGTPGAAPMPGSSQSSGQADGSTSAGQPGSDPSAGMPDSSPAGGQAGSNRTSGAGDEPGNAGQQDAGRGSAGQKSDEEILADALEDFERSMRRQQTAGEGEEQNGAAGPGGEQAPGEGPLSREERTRDLDGKLDKEFAEFDEMILGERQAVTRRDNEAGYSGSGGMAGQSGEEPVQTAMIEGSGVSGSDQTASARSQAIPEDYKLPDDIDEGQDDDIIAKQLREAAMKEKDPELREKLWDEYRKYKKDLQANR